VWRELATFEKMNYSSLNATLATAKNVALMVVSRKTEIILQQ